MKQIVDKLNKIALAIDENVEIPTTDLIIDSLDAITKAYGGTPNDSKLIVDKLEAISEVAHGGTTPTGTINITENTEPGSPLDIAQYRYADVNVSGGSITNLEFTDNEVDEVWESVKTVSQIITDSANELQGVKKTDTVLTGVNQLPLNLQCAITMIMENEDVPGTYDIVITPLEYGGVNVYADIFMAECDPTEPIKLSYGL